MGAAGTDGQPPIGDERVHGIGEPLPAPRFQEWGRGY